MKTILILLFFTITFQIYSKKINYEDDIETIIKSLTTEEKVGQLFNIAIVGKTLKDEYKTFLTKYQIGGITLFDYNMKSREQLKDFVDSLQKIMKIPLFISIDQEGGRITRYTQGHFLPPSPFMIGFIDDDNVTEIIAKYIAKDLKHVGINLNLAPVADVLTNYKNTAIFDRSFGTDYEKVSKHTSIYIKVLQENGVIATAKHFPGQGDIIADTHKTLPISKLSKKDLFKRELKPFIEAIENDVGVIMTSHVIFGGVDPKMPATLSKVFLKDILRDELKYKSVVFSDGLEMKAIIDTFGLKKASVLCFQNGIDMITLNWDIKHAQIAIDSVLEAIENGEIKIKDIDDKLRRVLSLKKKHINLNNKETFKSEYAVEFLRTLYNYAIITQNVTEDEYRELKNKKIYTNIKKINFENITHTTSFNDIRDGVIIISTLKGIKADVLKKNTIIFLGPKIYFDNMKWSKAVILHDNNYFTHDIIKNLLKEEKVD